MTKNNTESIDYQITYFAIPGLTICLAGAILNSLLLITFIKDPLKCFRNSATYLVMNLAISDCASCLLAFAQPFILLKFAQQAILGLFIFWLGTLSCVSIVSISIDRFLMVTYPIKHRIWMKGRFMSLWVGAIWIVSCLPSVLSLLNDHNKSSLNGIFAFGVIPVIMSAVMYFSTYCQLRKQSKNISLQNSSETIEHRMRIMKEKRFLKTIIIIACIAFFCLVPSLIFFIFMPTNLQGDDLDSRTWNTIFQSMFYANFAVNPLIYILRLPNYRKSFYKLYCTRGSWLVGSNFKFFWQWWLTVCLKSEI